MTEPFEELTTMRTYRVWVRYKDGQVGGAHIFLTRREADECVAKLQRRGFEKEGKGQRIEVWRTTERRIR